MIDRSAERMARDLDHGYSRGASHMHRAGIVANENTAMLEQGTYLAKREPSGEAHRTITTSVSHLQSSRRIFRSADDHNRSPQSLANFRRDGLKTLDWPAPAFGAGADADGYDRRRNACGLERCIDRPLVLRSRVQLEPDIPHVATKQAQDVQA